MATGNRTPRQRWSPRELYDHRREDDVEGGLEPGEGGQILYPGKEPREQHIDRIRDEQRGPRELVVQHTVGITRVPRVDDQDQDGHHGERDDPEVHEVGDAALVRGAELERACLAAPLASTRCPLVGSSWVSAVGTPAGSGPPPRCPSVVIGSACPCIPAGPYVWMEPAMLKIGRYMAMSRPPTPTPRKTRMIGSRSAVMAVTAASTSSS